MFNRGRVDDVPCVVDCPGRKVGCRSGCAKWSEFVERRAAERVAILNKKRVANLAALGKRWA